MRGRGCWVRWYVPSRYVFSTIIFLFLNVFTVCWLQTITVWILWANDGVFFRESIELCQIMGCSQLTLFKIKISGLQLSQFQSPCAENSASHLSLQRQLVHRSFHSVVPDLMCFRVAIQKFRCWIGTASESAISCCGIDSILHDSLRTSEILKDFSETIWMFS